MFKNYNTQQISPPFRQYSLREKLDYFNLDWKTMDEVSQEVKENSFFKSIVIPSFEDFAGRKTKGKSFSFLEFKQKELDIKCRFEKIIEFKNEKVSNHINKAIKNAEANILSMLSRNDRIIMEMFRDKYAIMSNNHYYWRLDNLLNFYIDYIKIGFSNSMILSRIVKVIESKKKNIIGGINQAENIPIFSLYRILVNCLRRSIYDFIETIYTLQYSLDILKLFIKRNHNLSSFKDNPKLLVNLIRCDFRHYDKYSIGLNYLTNSSLSKEQAIQFAKFYLTTEDKRLNTRHIISEVCLHLKKYGEQDLIDELVLNHHRVYSFIIAGNITKDSYSEVAKAFLKHILSKEGYNKFSYLIEEDDKNRLSNAIKI